MKKVKMYFPVTKKYNDITYEGDQIHEIEDRADGYVKRWLKRGCKLVDEKDVARVAREEAKKAKDAKEAKDAADKLVVDKAAADKEAADKVTSKAVADDAANKDK